MDYIHKQMHEGKEKSSTPLIMASIFGHVSAVTLLIESGADVNTALHALAEVGHVPVLELLISKGARVDARLKDGMTPLHSAAANRSEEAAVYLLDHGAEVNLGHRWTNSLDCSIIHWQC